MDEDWSVSRPSGWWHARQPDGRIMIMEFTFGRPPHAGRNWKGPASGSGSGGRGVPLGSMAMTLLSSPILPDILYLLFVLGLWTLALAVVTPGTGVLEVLAVGGLGLAAVGTAFVPINGWALIPLVLGLAFFALSLLGRRTWLWLLLAAASESLGSAFLFVTPAGSPAVDPILAILTSALTVGFFWLAVGKALIAQRSRPRVEPLDVVGRTGEARTAIDPTGSAYVAGELWSVRSEDPIAVGTHVRVIERDGLVLTVVPQDDPAGEAK